MVTLPWPEKDSGDLVPVSLGALTSYFLRLGAFGFGGPIALTAAMQRDLVLTRRWIAPAEYKEGLTLAQLAPGPLAAQLAMYLGWARAGTFGATAAGLALVGPSFAMVLVLSAFYMRYGGLPWMLGAFYGIGAAIIAIVTRGTEKLLQTTVGRDPLLWLVALVDAVVVGMASTDTLFRILGFFAEAAVVVFGSGLAVVPFLHGAWIESTAASPSASSWTASRSRWRGCGVCRSRW